MFEPGANQRPAFFHFDFHFRFSILFGHALSTSFIGFYDDCDYLLWVPVMPTNTFYNFL